MKVFVTGASGFIGKNLVAKLKDDGHIVTTYSRSNGGDILDYDSLSKCIIGHDVVVHLAASLYVTGGSVDSKEFININIIGSLNVIKACIAAGVSKIINLSSAAVYSDGSIFTSEDENVNPGNAYGVSKLAIEQYLRIIPDLKHVNIRTPLVYGPGDNSNRVFNKFLQKCKNKEDLLLFKGGEKQVLDYIHVYDLCDFIVYCLDKESGTFNVCTGEPINVGILANMCKDHYNVNVIIEDVAPGEYSKVSPTLKRTLNEVKGVSLSNEKVSKTGWKPKITNMFGSDL